MKIEKYKNLTFDELYNLDCFQNVPIIEFKTDLIGDINKLINTFFDEWGNINFDDKIYFHCFVLDEMQYTSNQIIVFVSINKTVLIGGLICDFERGCEYLLFGENDIEYCTLFELLNGG